MTVTLIFFPRIMALSFWTCGTMSRSPLSGVSLADTIRSLLTSRGLTVAEVSRRSRSVSAFQRHHHIQHNIYDAIRHRHFNPSLYQLAALSTLSGYRFVDWLQLFGFSLDQVVHFQCTFSASRTMELDPRIYHPQTGIPWFKDVAAPDFGADLLPLSRWLGAGVPRVAASLGSGDKRAFRFVKIGTEDAYAFPDLLPGSIVRIDPRPGAFRQRFGHFQSKKLFLVEHDGELVCSPIHWTDKNHFVVCSRHLPYTSMELERGPRAAILGIADAEFRRTSKAEMASVPKTLKTFRWPPVLFRPRSKDSLGDFLRRARKRAGVSFREASARTSVIAQTLHDPRYFCAPGSLSDYETRSSAPRHIHKVISICAVYFANVQDFLKTAGIDLDALGSLPMPVEVFGRPVLRTVFEPTVPSLGMQLFKQRFGSIPYFLHHSIPTYFGMADLSVRDIFWAGGIRNSTHRFLRNAAFLIVDRKRKKAVTSLSCPKWAQPLYVFLRRDGTYLCGPYSRANGLLIIHPYIAGLPTLLHLRDRDEVEVIGRVVGIVRSVK